MDATDGLPRQLTGYLWGQGDSTEAAAAVHPQSHQDPNRHGVHCMGVWSCIQTICTPRFTRFTAGRLLQICEKLLPQSLAVRVVAVAV